MTVDDFLCEIKPLFPNLKHLLSSAIHTLKEGEIIASNVVGKALMTFLSVLPISQLIHIGDGTCQENWKLQSVGASNPSMPSMVISESSVSAMVFKEVLNCFSKVTILSSFMCRLSSSSLCV